MEDIKEKKSEIRANIAKIFNSLSEDDLSEKTKNIEYRLFDFANFLESKVVLLYINRPNEVNTSRIIKRTYKQNKIVVLPSFDMTWPPTVSGNLFRYRGLNKSLIILTERSGLRLTALLTLLKSQRKGQPVMK